MFDAHIRIGGTTGTNLETDTCEKHKQLDALPRASFLNLHVTPKASGYFQNVWIWTADQYVGRLTQCVGQRCARADQRTQRAWGVD